MLVSVAKPLISPDNPVMPATRPCRLAGAMPEAALAACSSRVAKLACITALLQLTNRYRNV
jgi:hypothetical protein